MPAGGRKPCGHRSHGSDKSEQPHLVGELGAWVAFVDAGQHVPHVARPARQTEEAGAGLQTLGDLDRRRFPNVHERFDQLEETVRFQGLEFRTERVEGRRIASVAIVPVPDSV